MVALLATISNGQFLHDHAAGHFPYQPQFGGFPSFPHKEDQSKYQIDDAQNSAVVVQSSDLSSDEKPSAIDSDIIQSPSSSSIYNPGFYKPQYPGFYQPKPHPFYQYHPNRYGYPGYPFFNPFYQFGIPQQQYSPFYQHQQPSPYGGGFLNYPNRVQQPYHPLANRQPNRPIKPIYKGVQPYPVQPQQYKENNQYQHSFIRPNFQHENPYFDDSYQQFNYPKQGDDVESVVVAAKESVYDDGSEFKGKQEDDLMGSLTTKQIEGLYRLLG